MCIKYPTIESEFEVQAHLYHSLRTMGLDARGEVVLWETPKERPPGPACRFDIVVFVDQAATLVIEVKKEWPAGEGIGYSQGHKLVKQLRKYRIKTGLPVVEAVGLRGATELIDKIRSNGIGSFVSALA